MIHLNLNTGRGLAGPGSLGTNSSGFGSGFQSYATTTALIQMMVQVLNMFMGGGGLPMFGNFGNPYRGTGLTNFLGAPPRSKDADHTDEEDPER